MIIINMNIKLFIKPTTYTEGFDIEINTNEKVSELCKKINLGDSSKYTLIYNNDRLVEENKLSFYGLKNNDIINVFLDYHYNEELINKIVDMGFNKGDVIYAIYNLHGITTSNLKSYKIL